MTRPAFFLSCMLILLPGVAGAIGAFNPSANELAFLPPYCAPKAKTNGNDINDPQVAKWSAVLGRKNYLHVHHYCDALLHIFRADMAISDEGKAGHFLNIALDNISYSQRNSTEDFILLPEMALKKGRVLERMGQVNEAVIQYQKAIGYKPDYGPAYAELSDYYVKIGQREKALEIIHRGLEVVPNYAPLLRRNKELSK